jgi:tetratricopeptide (TPR) repeat protein
VKCETVQSETVVERYVLGQLSAAEQNAFEEHFFSCDACLEEVRLMQGLQAAAKARPRQMPSRKWIAWGAVAALLLAGFGLVQMSRPRQPEGTAHPVAVAESPSELRLLGQIEAPRYIPSNLRSGSGDRDQKFRAAMAKYTEGDYAAAAGELRGLDQAAARFYLGVCDIMIDNRDEAVSQLRSVEAMGETPYLEPARFFLAKALLANKDAAGAAQALEQTIALKGDREAEARRLLEQVRALPPGR